MLTHNYVTGSRKRAHFAHESIFQNKLLKFVTPYDLVHQFSCFEMHFKAQNKLFLMG